MKALLRIILFVTTDVAEKVKKYSNDDKTAMILIYGEYNKNASAVARLCKQYTFSQKLFFHNFI
jgi:hypothetical protein